MEGFKRSNMVGLSFERIALLTVLKIDVWSKERRGRPGSKVSQYYNEKLPGLGGVAQAGVSGNWVPDNSEGRTDRIFQQTGCES